MSSLDSSKKITIVLLAIILLGVLPLIGIILLWPGFRVYEFEDRVEYIYGKEIELHKGNICYGNTFSCDNVEVNVSTFDKEKLGEQEIVYTYQYKNKSLEKKQIIVIEDKVSPTIKLEEETLYYCPSKKFYDYHISALDDYDGDLTSSITTEIKENEALFKVQDSSGNQFEYKVKTELKDEEKPIITLNGNAKMSIVLNSYYTDPGASATDNCDGDITSKIEIIGKVNPNKTGEYKITYKVKDTMGNEDSKTRVVYVYAKNQTIVPSGKVVYLTFDDGPGPYTEKLLNVLKKYNVKVTFFVTDQNISKGYDNMIKRAYEEGHTIGLHTKTHDYSSIYSSKEAYFNDLYAIQNKVKTITGFTSYIIRFPGGSSNTISKNYDRGTHIMSELTKAVEAKGFVYFDWNVSSGDAGETTLTSKVAANVIDGISRRNPAVVLQHDIKSYSVDAVESIIEYGLSHGYQFLPITKTSPTAHHGVNN